MTRTTVLELYDECGVCNGPGAIYDVDVLISEETVTVMVTSLTLRRLWWRLCC